MLLGICVFWNGIVAVFMFIAYGSLLAMLGIIPKGSLPLVNGVPPTWGMTIFLLLFLIPFELVGLVLLLAFLHAVFGRVRVKIAGDEGTVFSGIGPFGIRRRFRLADVRRIRERTKTVRGSDGDSHKKTEIEIEGDTTLRFGSGLPDKRRRWLCATLRSILLPDGVHAR